jgi:hypothetical protein
MKSAKGSRRRVLLIQRGWERSRVEEQLMIDVFERIAPEVRRRIEPSKSKRRVADSHPKIIPSPFAA